MTPDTRQGLEARLIEDEGEKLHAYEDSKGFITIGVGRLLDKRKGGGISHEESRFLLHNDIERIETEMARLFPWAKDLSPNRQIVLASMLFQMGAAGVMTFKHTLGCMKAGRYFAAARAMEDSKWAREDSPARAKRLVDLMEQG